MAATRKIGTLGLAVLLCFLAGCEKYRPAPLDPLATVARIEAQRLAPAGDPKELAGQPLTLERAADWLRRHGPEVQETLAEFRTAHAVARIDTPLPNPALEIGPQFGFGPDLAPVNRAAPFGSIGFTIPLGKRLRRQTELNRAYAEVARVHALARFRELYLELRAHYAGLAIAAQRVQAREAIGAGSKQSLEAGRRLVEAGQAAALDVAMFELEYQRSQAELLAARREAADAESALAGLLGVNALTTRTLPDDPLPALPAELPALDLLKEALVAEHTGLARLRARYEASERALRLEISKQVPDFTFGPGWDNEVGERKTVLGLTLGIELPIFDRNQQGIAEAKHRREEVRTQYESEIKRALAGLEHAHAALGIARENRILLNEKILPKAEGNVALARRSVEAGATDAFQLLDAERSARSVKIEALEAELAERKAWSELELAVGRPLVRFAGDERAAEPPEVLRPPDFNGPDHQPASESPDEGRKAR